jgi:hypothetical protein
LDIERQANEVRGQLEKSNAFQLSNDQLLEAGRLSSRLRQTR